MDALRDALGSWRRGTHGLPNLAIAPFRRVDPPAQANRIRVVPSSCSARRGARMDSGRLRLVLNAFVTPRRTSTLPPAREEFKRQHRL